MIGPKRDGTVEHVTQGRLLGSNGDGETGADGDRENIFPFSGKLKQD